MKQGRFVQSLHWKGPHWKALAQWAAALAEILAVAAILAMAFTAGNYIAAQKAALEAASSASAPGIFESHGDVGTVLHAGAVEYDTAKQTYTIAGSGENMWSTKDAFQFAWERASGDVMLTADIAFLGKGAQEHRKAVLMVRQSLEADSVYADVALHGNGLTSLQYRGEKGAATHEIQANISAPKRLRLVKRGAYFSMWLADESGKFYLASGSTRIALQEPFYVGIGVCSHDANVIEKAVFSSVSVDAKPAPTGMGSNSDAPNANAAPPSATSSTLYSVLEVVTVDSTDRRVVYIAPGRFEAPNWMPDGKHLLFNRNGHIEKIAVSGSPLNSQPNNFAAPHALDTGFATRCNNDHLISPDGTQLGISDNSQEDHKSLVYIAPVGGGAPRRITQQSPSYLHGWSPDGKTLAFVGERNGDFDIYAIPAAGGEETRLTTAKGLDDGPEYTRDGHIYFNSERTGHMQIWRMSPDGSEQEQVTFGQDNDWFPHISPDGKWMVFLSYDKSVSGHPENKDVSLRLMSLPPVILRSDATKNLSSNAANATTANFKSAKITVLAKLFGGQGTINVPSWSPDGKQLAFVSYQLVTKETM